MDILAILGISALLRALRRPRNRDRSTTQPSPTSADTPVAPTPLIFDMPSRRLLRRAGEGLLLAGLVLVAALLPWPTAWAFSAALAPDVHRAQIFILRNTDCITIATTVFSMIEPLIVLLFKRLRQVPRLLRLCMRLAWVRVKLDYWRTRNWHARRRWSRTKAASAA
jgi:hypothetical protein